MTWPQLWALCCLGLAFPFDRPPSGGLVVNVYVGEFGHSEVTLGSGDTLYFNSDVVVHRAYAPLSRPELRPGQRVLVYQTWHPYGRRVAVLSDPYEDEEFLHALEEWVQDTVPHEDFARWLRPHSRHLAAQLAAPCWECREAAERDIRVMPQHQRIILEAFGRREPDPEVRWRMDRDRATVMPGSRR